MFHRPTEQGLCRIRRFLLLRRGHLQLQQLGRPEDKRRFLPLGQTVPSVRVRQEILQASRNRRRKSGRGERIGKCKWMPDKQGTETRVLSSLSLSLSSRVLLVRVCVCPSTIHQVPPSPPLATFPPPPQPATPHCLTAFLP